MTLGFRQDVSQELSSEIQEMCLKAEEMLQIAREAFRRQDSGRLGRARQLGREIHEQEKKLTQRLPGKFGAAPDLGVEASYSFLPLHLERIGDNIESLVLAIQTTIKDGIPFSERAMKEIDTLFEKIIELVGCMRDAIATRNKVLIRHILKEGPTYERCISEFAVSHQERLIEGLCAPKASSMYLALLDYLKGIESHVRQMAQKLG